MEAIRAIQTVENGQVNINLPQQFWGQQVEIIVLPTLPNNGRMSPLKTLRGSLRQYANAALIEHEDEAWHNAIHEKYDELTFCV